MAPLGRDWFTATKGQATYCWRKSTREALATCAFFGGAVDASDWTGHSRCNLGGSNCGCVSIFVGERNLLTECDTPTRQRRRSAALAGFHGDVNATIAFCDDPSPLVCIAALRSLAKLHTDKVLVNESLLTSKLQCALGDNSAQVRIAALEIAAHYIEPPIWHLLDDLEPMVVEAAAWALGEREAANDEILTRLADTAHKHADPLVRESAVAALAAIGDPRGLPAILAATRDKTTIRRRGAIALAAFEGPEVTSAYQRLLKDRDRQVRDAARELMDSLDEPSKQRS